jgi:hypothetical protein
MAATTLRERFIDDTDPAVQYATNDWFVADPGVEEGNARPVDSW